MITENSLLESAVAAKQFKTKLKNMREHLQALIDKKLRLEIEIKQLKSSIQEKQTNYNREVKIKLQLESDSSMVSQLREEGLYDKDHYDDLHALSEFYSELKETTVFLEENYHNFF